MLVIPQELWRAFYYLYVLIRLYSSRLKVCSTLDPKTCSKMKMLSKSTFEEGEPSDLNSNALIQGFARRSGCFLPANFKYLQTLDTEESRGVQNHLVLDVQLL